eukprot:TRINITY_DN3746_c0_g1_i17.p1 TRINITY_DN3746_c0_g1~~TRINITY_DN3746_c0_g1_i17.p1  ORF type:complete len:341 (-),score=104.96 TRINITY_DN3746_c0_g1_i17:101-1123(-)
MVEYNPYALDSADGLYLHGQDPLDNHEPPYGSEMGGDAFDESSEKADQGQDGDTELTQRQKHKRRSKNDLKGRDYQCGCGKRYLSYPALYTHIKTKHNGQNPKGTNAPQYQTKRGRGRPRKSNIAIAPVNPVPEVVEEPVESETKEVQKQEEEEEKVEVYNEDETLKKLGALEGEKYEPLVMVENFLRQIHEDKIPNYLWLQKYLRMSAEQEEEKKEELEGPRKTCEQIFAEYICEVGRKVNERFFFILIIFVNAYRQCMDEYGWEMTKKYKQVTFDERRRSFTAHNDAELVPESSNDFIRYFLPKENPYFDRNMAIELTRHLCEWLGRNKYTHASISLL